jgi:methanogen homoaconitase small subunit
VGAIIALSFARIFYRNALNLGIPLYESPEIVAALQDGDTLTLDIPANQVRAGEVTFTLPELPSFARQILDAGGIVPYVKAHGRFPWEGEV